LEAEGYNKMANSMSEDAMFKALLKNKPAKQNSAAAQKMQVTLRNEVKRPVPAAEPVETHKIEKPVIEPKITNPVEPLNIEPVVESINNLSASVNMVYGLMRTVVVPVLVLILIIGIAILIKP
jgi:hypothetical protein